MRKSVYAKLAVTNIRKNRSTYIPYMLTCIVCIAMLYMMFFIYGNEGILTLQAGATVQLVLALGIAVVAIFSVIFLLYCNSYVMKRRQKEIGLYNILGMEKGHIGRMMFIETVLTSLVSLILGIALGILGSKLALLLLLKLLHLPAIFGFYVYGSGIVRCCLLFGGIFLLTLFFNLRRVHVSRPIELLRGGSTGEREPKAKLLMAFLGFVCLGVGYYIAVTTKNPVDALLLFFLAVLLVMVGTYLLFTAGSIVILKIMRWKKSFYYKTRNFTSVSGMLYRMKQNAVGLSNICILSTGVLLMLSTTVSLNYGMKDVVNHLYPWDVSFSMNVSSLEEARQVEAEAEKAASKNGIAMENLTKYMYLDVACAEEKGVYTFRKPESASESFDYHVLALLPQEVYADLTGENQELTDGQVLLYSEGERPETITVGDTSFEIMGEIEKWPLPENPDPFTQANNSLLVVTDHDFEKINAMQREAYKDSVYSNVEAVVGFDVVGDAEEEIASGHKIDETFLTYAKSAEAPEGFWYRANIREEARQDAYTLYGGFLFLGIFLGGLFLMGTAMIIYYKQISEGYDDKERFEIMRKVGMSRREVRSSIRRQILMIFFLPLLMAVVHIIMAFPLVKRLLGLFALDNVPLFAICTVITILIFAVVYGIIYLLTAKAYYRILEKAE
jgi:putative ABC transport system permease protein